MVPYKRVELVVEAFRRMPGRRLVVTGDGPSRCRWSAHAAAGAPNIELRGRVPQAELVALTQTARAVMFAAEEDFGIAMVEAQACGTPLIAFGRGGARDIVQTGEAPTGLLFDRADPGGDHRGGRALRGAGPGDFARGLPRQCPALLRGSLPRGDPRPVGALLPCDSR